MAPRVDSLQDETCVSYEWIDLRGETRKGEQLCTPGRCLVLRHDKPNS